MHELGFSNLLFRKWRPVAPTSWLICQWNVFKQHPLFCFICIYTQQLFKTHRHKWTHTSTLSPRVSWGEESAMCIFKFARWVCQNVLFCFFTIYLFVHKLGLRSTHTHNTPVLLSLASSLCMSVCVSAWVREHQRKVARTEIQWSENGHFFSPRSFMVKTPKLRWYT